MTPYRIAAPRPVATLTLAPYLPTDFAYVAICTLAVLTCAVGCLACICCKLPPLARGMTSTDGAFMAGAAYMVTHALRDGDIHQLCERHGRMLASVLDGVQQGHEEALETARKAAL